MADSKKIKILTSGPIRTIGFIWGPVLTPYNEKINNIFKMLSENIDIVEVADDGAEVKLTLQNLNEDNSKNARVSKQAEQEAKKAAKEAAKQKAISDAKEKEKAELEAKAKAEAEKKRLEEVAKAEEVEEVIDAQVEEETPVAEKPIQRRTKK